MRSAVSIMTAAVFAVFAAVVPATASADEPPTMESSSLSSDSESAHTLSVADALERARTYSHEIQLGQLSLQRSALSTDEIRAGRLPDVSLEGQYFSHISRPVIVLPETSPFGEGLMETGARHNFDASIRASVPLYSPQLNRSIDLADLAEEVEHNLHRATVHEVEIEVQRAYLNGLMARKVVDVLQESRQTLEHNLELVEALYDEEAAPEYDVIRMEVQLQNMEPELLTALNNYQGALNYLKLLTGIPIEEAVELDVTLEQFYDSVPEIPFEADFENNRDVIEIEGQRQIADRQIDVERAAYLPTLAAFGNFTYQGQADNLRVWDYEWTDSAMIGLSVTVPLFSPGRRQRLEQARMELRHAELQREFLQESLHAEFETTRNRILQLEEAIAAQQRNIEQAEHGYEIASVSYEEGAYSLIEVNDAEEALREARLNYSQLLGDYMSALLDMEALIGSTFTTTAHE